MSFNMNVLVHKQNLAPVNVLTPFSMINNKPSDLVKATIYIHTFNIIQPVFCVNFSLHPVFCSVSVLVRCAQYSGGLQWIECCLHIPNLIHWLLVSRAQAFEMRPSSAGAISKNKGEIAVAFPPVQFVLEQCHCFQSLFVDSGCSFRILVWWANHKFFHWNLAQHYQKEAWCMTTTLLPYKQKERMKFYRSYVQI